MGRSRKIQGTSMGKIGKEKKLNRKLQEEKLKTNRNYIELHPPDWLSDDARDEFDRVVAETANINILDNLDYMALAIYADNYARYVECANAIRSEGLLTEGGSPTPYIAVMREAQNAIMRCSIKLGLFATDRLKLVAPTIEEKAVNKFLNFIEK